MLGPLLFTAYISHIGRVVRRLLSCCQSSYICWWYAVRWNGWWGLSGLALALHHLLPALVPAQPPATEWKQVWGHHHWVCSMSRLVAAVITDKCRRARVWSSSAWCMIVPWFSISTCHFYMSGLRHFRSLVSDEVTHQIACSIVGSILHYCNSLLLNCSNRNLDKMQRVQNNLARVVCNSSRLTPAEPLLRSLHWLSVHQRID